MKKVTSLLAIGLLGCAAMYVSGEETAAPATQPVAAAPATAPTTQASVDKPVNKFCAVETANVIDEKGGTYVYKGKTIGFCCPDCIDEFKKDPEKYMATLK